MVHQRNLAPAVTTRALTILVLTIALELVSGTAAASGGCVGDACLGPTATSTSVDATASSGGYRVEFYHANGTGQWLTAIGASGDRYLWSWQPACPTNSPGSSYTYICTGLNNDCPVQGDVRYWISYSDLSLVPPDGWHRLPGYYCLGPNPTVDLGGIQAQVQREFRVLPLPPAEITVQPPGSAVVNIPVIAYTDTPRSKVFQITVLGANVTLTAAPQSWTWNWGVGTTPTITDGPGAAYPTCQAASSTCAAYTFHEPGTYGPLTVTVYWTASYTISGVTQTFDISTPVPVTSTGRDLAVDTAPPQLVYTGGP